MPDYQPLDLDALYNAGLALLPEGPPPPIGEQSLRGLPFRIGADAARCFLVLGRDAAPADVAVAIPRRAGRDVRTILVAHRLLESDLLAGGPVGVEVAHYVVRYADGAEVALPIRDRFEIGTVPTAWGQQPFNAVPDRNNATLPRWEGRYDTTGRRQTEVSQASPRGYVLWAWVNPRPDEPIASIAIRPRGPRFLVAAITLGHVDEFPFVREGARDIRIVLTDPAAAARPFNLEVAVDRGTATYPYALSAASTEEYLADPLAGWGEPPNPSSSPAYSRVAAIPSATVVVSQDGATLARAGWRELEERGAVAGERARVEIVDRGRNWVRTTIVDDQTGRPVPCRVHFRSTEGIPYQPHGHHDHVNSNLDSWHVDVGGDLRLGQLSYAYVDGTCEGWLPRGEAIVDVARGFEYEPLRERVVIAPGQCRLELRLKRWRDMNAERWFSGDTHVHFLSAQGSHTEAQGEDLNVVNLLLSQWGHLFTNSEEFTGEPSVSRDGRTIVYATQENRQHFLGHLTLLGLKRPVMPWCSDGPGEAELGGTLEVTMSDWADRCHAQGGTVILPHLPSPNGEPAALIATGRVDGVEMIRHGTYPHLEYYRYLNCGYRLPLCGGTDKMSSEVPVGLYRTYVHVPPGEEFTYDSWCRNLTAGRTFLSGGPMISLLVEGKMVGDTVRLPPGGGTIEVEAVAESALPIHTLEIVQQGNVVATTRAPAGARRLRIKTALRATGHSWLAARAGGPTYERAVAHRDVWTRGLFAHTSPVYVACGGDWELFDPATARYMLTLIEGNLTYIGDHAARYRPGTTTHHHGEDDHLAYLKRPFLEARDAIHRRLHRLGIAH